ncbi:hypothetical protein L7F22_048148 [Adiantum nelumboides]|nr:hypothetical protein [Adiantum nelumboides]
MLQVAGLPNTYWEEAVATACYLQNRLNGSTTPYASWFGQSPDLSHLRIFGCPAYPFIPSPLRNKLEPRACRLIFVGYGERFGMKAYRLYNPENRRFSLSRSVYFNELALISEPFLLPSSSSASSPLDTQHDTHEFPDV